MENPISNSDTQAALFEPTEALPHGLVYQPDFLTPEEEAWLLEEFAGLPFAEAHFQHYTARRRVVRYGEGDYPALRSFVLKL